MREILFKGKRLDNGEWVKGYIYRYGTGKWYIVPTGNSKKHFAIIPSTLCQFTGLRDKNGKRIWEGDRVHCHPEDMQGTVWFKNGSFLTDATGFGDTSVAELLGGEFTRLGSIHDKEQV